MSLLSGTNSPIPAWADSLCLRAEDPGRILDEVPEMFLLSGTNSPVPAWADSPCLKAEDPGDFCMEQLRCLCSLEQTEGALQHNNN